MDNNLNRVATFNKWPKGHSVSPLSLAENGFFFTQVEDQVECYSCHVKIKNWKASDSVPARHKQSSVHCEHITSVSRGVLRNRSTTEENVEENSSDPLHNTNIHVQNPTTNTNRSRDFTIETDEDEADSNIQVPQSNTRLREVGRIVPNDVPQMNAPVLIRSNSDVLNILSQSNEETQNWLSTRRIEETTSRTVDYTVEINRLASFNGNWSESSPVTASDLASGGLYFTGPGDRVQCAYCRGGLYNWAAGDTVIGEHVRHFPHCSFAQDRLRDLLGKKKGTGQIEEKRESNTEQEGGTGENDWINAPAVKIAQGMGYHMGMIKKAAEKVLACSCKQLSSNTLMDALFEIELTSRGEVADTENDSDNDDIYSPGGAVGGETISRTTLVSKNISSESETIKEGEDVQHSSEDNSVSREYKENEVKELLEENQRLRGNMTCKICLDASVDTLFLPCRHLVSCEECASAVKSCPLCRTLIIGTVKTFL